MVVQHNMQAANANRMLGITVDSISKSTEKLSSGYRINRAADDAAGLSISEKMRKQIRGLSQASTNAQDGISAVQTAEGALTEVHSMLQRMNELAVQSANGTNSETDRSAIQAEINQLQTEIDRVSDTTKFNETYLLKGDTDGTRAKAFSYRESSEIMTLANGQKLYTRDSAGNYTELQKGAILDSDETYYTGGETTVTKAGTAFAASSDLASAAASSVFTEDAENKVFKKLGSDYVSVKVGEYASDATYYTMDSNKGYGDIKDAAIAVLQSELSTKATGSVASAAVTSVDAYDGNGNSVSVGTIIDAAKYSQYFSAVGDETKTTYSAVDSSDLSKYGNTETIKFKDADGNSVPANGLYKYFNADGTYKGNGLYYTDATGKFTELGKSDKDKQLLEANIKVGEENTGSLKLALHVGADSTENNKISIEISSMSAETLGVKDLKVSTEDEATAAIDTISAALQKVSEQRSNLGAVQNRLEHTISNLDNVVENTTSAESRIRDVDMAEEMVTYSKNSILQQAGQSMLAQANQANQGVLSLLG